MSNPFHTCSSETYSNPKNETCFQFNCKVGSKDSPCPGSEHAGNLSCISGYNDTNSEEFVCMSTILKDKLNLMPKGMQTCPEFFKKNIKKNLNFKCTNDKVVYGCQYPGLDYNIKQFKKIREKKNNNKSKNSQDNNSPLNPDDPSKNNSPNIPN